MQTAVVKSNKFSSQHDVKGINEGPDRIKVILSHLQSCGILDKCTLVEPEPCDLSILKLNHSDQYIEDFRSSCELGKKVIEYSASDLDAFYLKNYFSKWMGEDTFSTISPNERKEFRLAIQELSSRDTPITYDSFDTARLASGAAIDAVRLVLDKKARNAFAIIRPPGHHAEFDAAMGFCFFNNVAVAARYLLENGLSRIAIIDWDVHHGNGAQHSFYDEPKVLVCNIHREPPFYPGFCGYKDEMGTGKGEGFNLNIPLPGGSGTAEYKLALAEVISKLDTFKPEFILISNGFDAHAQDPLGGMKLPISFFRYMTEQVVLAAQKHCEGRLVSILEGGYNRSVIGEIAFEHLKVLIEYS